MGKRFPEVKSNDCIPKSRFGSRGFAPARFSIRVFHINQLSRPQTKYTDIDIAKQSAHDSDQIT